MEKELEKLQEALEKKISEHDHDGYDSKKINGSSIAINTFSLKNIRAVSLTDAVKTIDGLLDTKQDKLKGTSGKIVTYISEGQTGELDPEFFSQKDHVHKQYAIVEPGESSTSIPILQDGVLKRTNLTPEVIATKEDLLKSESNTEAMESQIREEIESLFEMYKEQKNHSHKDFTSKVKGNNDLFVIDENGDLISTGIRADDIVLKRDIAKLVLVVMAEELKSIKEELSNKALSEHTHPPIDLSSYLKKDQLLPELKKNL